MALVEQPHGIQPLTHIGSKGVYHRSAEVEAQIASALVLDPAQMRQRAQQSDYARPEYLSPECLVYLIRECKEQGDEETVSALLPTPADIEQLMRLAA